MATPAKKEPELPLEPFEAKPLTSEEVEFEVLFHPWVLGTDVLWNWKVIGNNFKPWVGDWTGLKSVGHLDSKEEAEKDARRMIENTRRVIALKLDAPEEYRLKL